jgi:hypothetical protein
VNTISANGFSAERWLSKEAVLGQLLGLLCSNPVYLLLTRGDTELPEVPAGGFDALADAAHVKGARVINQAGDVGVSATPNRYAFIREIVHRTLFRIPLR